MVCAWVRKCGVHWFLARNADHSGVCEICHTQTRFYRADGAGQEHFPFSCLPCHLHEAGFAPP